MVSGFLKWRYLQTFHIGRASLKRNSFNIEMRKIQYFTLAKTPPTENSRNFPCAGSGKFPIFSVAATTENFRNFPCAGTGKFPIFSVAATRSQSSGRQCPPALNSQRQPLAATCSHSSGRKWPPVSASIEFSAAATCSHSSGRQVAASVRQHSLLSGSHLQPLEWPPSGRQCPPALNSQRQPLAATRVAAKWPPVSASILFSAAATCSHSSGRKWPPVSASILFSAAATCSHLQPLEWPQVAARASQVAASGRQSKWPQVAARASGRKWPQVAAFAKIKFVPFCTLSVILCQIR